jgi:hypothetical protein
LVKTTEDESVDCSEYVNIGRAGSDFAFKESKHDIWDIDALGCSFPQIRLVNSRCLRYKRGASTGGKLEYLDF